MAITISGENNNDKILASDGVIDSLSSLNISGIATATTFVGNLIGNVTGDVGGNLTGNVTGNINNTTLLLQTGGYEKARITSNGAVIVAGTTAYSDGTFGEAKLQFNTKTGNHIGACSVADTNNSITHVLFKNPTGAIASVGTHNSDFIALTGNQERLRISSTGQLSVGTTADVTGVNVAIGGSMRLVNANDRTATISALPSGSYITGHSGGSAIAFHRFSDGGGGSDEIAFETHHQGNRHAESLRIEKTGNIKVNVGNLYFATAGKGIVLGATSNQDAHTLDHYQEGTSALTVKCGSVSVPLLNNTCKWTRIGNTLHLSAWIRVSGGQNASALTLSDPIKITGFPFTTVGNSTGRTRLVFTGYSFYNVTNATALWGWMVVQDGATSTEHELHWGNANWSGLVAPTGNNITSGGNYTSSEIYLNGHMFV